MSEWKERGRKALEWGEHIHFIGWLINAPWSTFISAAIAIGTVYWASVTKWVAQYGYLPIFLIGIFTFGVVLWVLNGIIWIRRQKRPSKARITFDYGYGVALDEITPSHDQTNESNNLEFRFQIRNVAPGPLKYKAERIDVIIDDRIKTARNITGVLPRNSWILLKVGGFEKQLIDELKDRTVGSYEYSILYGHPEDDYSRRATKRIRFDLIKKDGKVIAAPWVILEESDKPISQ